jgi:hypothetical protein
MPGSGPAGRRLPCSGGTRTWLLALSLSCITACASDPPTGAAHAAPVGETDIVLIRSGQKERHEYWQGERLRMVKVVPERGDAYFLVPETHPASESGNDAARGDDDWCGGQCRSVRRVKWVRASF